MKHIPTFVSLIAALLAAGFSVRFRSLPWLVPAYLIAQTLFTVVTWVAIQRDELDSPVYMKVFGALFVVVLGLAVWLSVSFLAGHSCRWWAIVSAVSLSACVGVAIYERLSQVYGSVPPQITLALLNGAVLSFCGLTVFISLIVEPEPATRYAAIALGSFWSVLGVLSFAFSLGIMGVKRAAWIHLNDFVPSFLAIVFFSWLAFQLNGLQAETAQQAIHSDAAPITEAQ